MTLGACSVLPRPSRLSTSERQKLFRETRIGLCSALRSNHAFERLKQRPSARREHADRRGAGIAHEEGVELPGRESDQHDDNRRHQYGIGLDMHRLRSAVEGLSLYRPRTRIEPKSARSDISDTTLPAVDC